MVTRNITLYTLDKNNKKVQIKSPYIINVGFKASTVTIYVAVDNDFENDSYSITCNNQNVVIKRVCNTITVSIEPNYDNEPLDINILFEHNMDKNDSIPLVIRQTWQVYDIILKADEDKCNDDDDNFIECFSYVSKNGAHIDHSTYRIRDNVLLNDNNENEKAVIENFDDLVISSDEVTQYMCQSGTDNYYIFIDDEYNDIIDAEVYNDQLDYKPYTYINKNVGDIIYCSEYNELPNESEETIGKNLYDVATYIKVYDSVVEMTPRYKYYPFLYRNTLTRSDYNALSNTSKSGCQPLTYQHIYDTEIEISVDEYNNLSRSDRFLYAPNRYVVFNNTDKKVCKTVVNATTYDTYPIEGKYDYIEDNDTYYRELDAEEYEKYPERGQIDYLPYQYINSKNKIIDFATYNDLSDNDKKSYRIYRYSGGDYVRTILMWQNINDESDVICDDVYQELSDSKKENYRYYYDHTKITKEEYAEGTYAWAHINECKAVRETEDARLISDQSYRDLSNIAKQFYRQVFYEPEEIITPSKYNSLPVYGKNAYHPYQLAIIDDNGEFTNDTVITYSEYLDIPLTRSDYVLDSVTVVDDRITCDAYKGMNEFDQKDYELCYRLDDVFKGGDSENEIVLKLDVLCAGGSYDYVINGITRYRRATAYNYSEDDVTYEEVHYKVNRGEEFIEESMPFKLEKQNSGEWIEIDGTGTKYAKQYLLVTIYGWLDSTFTNGLLDNDVFYRIEVGHKDIIGLNATLKVELGKDNRPLNDLTVSELAPTDNDDQWDNYDDNEPGDVIDGGDDELTPIVEVEPSIECEDELEFKAWQSSRTLAVATVPEDSVIDVRYTGNFIKSCIVNNHTIRIKVDANPFGIDRSCALTVINAEYPEVTKVVTIKQLGN